MPAVSIHGYAIVSADDRIADAEGRLPESLMNDADWAHFQAELDRADWVVLGRRSHEAAPNLRRRRRLVLSRAGPDLCEGPDAWWWNPERVPWPVVTERLLSEGGRVATPGGQEAFDLFLALGFTSFHLSRAGSVRLPGGRALFSAIDRGIPAERALANAGLVAREQRMLDEAASVTLTIFATAEA